MKSFQSLALWLISIGYSLTNKRKTATFVDFRLFRAFFWQFLTQFSTMADYNRFIFSAPLGYPNILRLRLIRAFFDAWFTQNKLLTELNLAISGVHFSFAIIFQYLKFV